MANDRDCESCKYHKEVCKNGIFCHFCESWDCKFEPKEDVEPQEGDDDEYIKVPKKALKYRTAGMVAYNAEWLKNHFDIERAVICGCECKDQKPCDDAISRQAAIDTIESWLSCDDYNEAERHIMRAVQSVLYDLPPVTPKPKSECEHDHEILKAHSDGANEVLDNVRAEIESKYESIPETFHHYETGFTDALEWVLSIIDKYKAEGSGEAL